MHSVPSWCGQYHTDEIGLIILDEYKSYPLKYYNENGTIGGEDELESFNRNNFGIAFVFMATIYLAVDITWICMVWSAASLGTPTETNNRDKYLRRLIIFKVFLGNFPPLLLLGFGLRKTHSLRANNYGCGEDNPTPKLAPTAGIWYGFFCALLFTYALELFVWPAIVTKHVIGILRSNSYLSRHFAKGKDERRAERLEHYVGLLLSCLMCLTRNRKTTDFRNKGELKDFACHFVSVQCGYIYMCTYLIYHANHASHIE